MISARSPRWRVAATGLTVASVLAATIALPASSAGGAAPVTLPDLTIMVPTDLISIGVDPNSGARDLRFTHITADVGIGPFEIDPTYNSNTGTSTFVQMIYNSPSPGVWQPDHTVPVTMTGNWHPPSDYQFPLTRFTLNTVNANGSPGAVVATSPKTDYCITGDYRLTNVENTPDQTFIPQSNCTDPTKPLGWSVGWADEYDQTDAGQPIDLTGIADGTYILHAVVDPQHVLSESNTSNDVTDTTLQITGTNVTVLSQTNPSPAPPTVSLTSPSAGVHVSGEVVLSASAAASAPATVASVQFLLDGQPLGGAVTGPPYTYHWTVGSTTQGQHLLSARVTDSAGNMATATPVPVIVDTGSPGGGPGPTGGGPGPSGGDGKPTFTVRSLTWRHGILTVVVSGLPKHATLSVTLQFTHDRSRHLIAQRGRLRVRTARPKAIVLRVLLGKRQLGRAIIARLGGRPTVRITNPTAGEILSGRVPVLAGATDDLAVSSVQFSIDGKRIGSPVTAPPYVIHWWTTRARSGRHSVTALATDPRGNTARATTEVTVENPAPPMTCFVLQADVSAHGRGTATASAFHTAIAGETLLALVSADGPAGPRQQSATVSGAGLPWKLVKRANTSSGDSEIWSVTAPTILTRAEVTSSLAKPGFDQSLTVIAIEGAAGVGSSAGASGKNGAARVDLVTRAATSLVFAVGEDWDRAAARRLPVDWVPLDQWLDRGSGDTFWSQYTNQPTGRARTVVAAKVTAPAIDQWNIAAVEVVNSGD